MAKKIKIGIVGVGLVGRAGTGGDDQGGSHQQQGKDYTETLFHTHFLHISTSVNPSYHWNP